MKITKTCKSNTNKTEKSVLRKIYNWKSTLSDWICSNIENESTTVLILICIITLTWVSVSLIISTYCWGYVISETRVALGRSTTPYWIGIFLAINPVFTSLGGLAMFLTFILSTLGVPNPIRITLFVVLFLILITNMFLAQKEER